MAKRKIITIDQEKCNGCEQCVNACAEGAIQMANGKAVLVADNLCDGFGDCLGECPTGALVIEEREVAAFDPDATRNHLRATGGEKAVRRFEEAHNRHEAGNPKAGNSMASGGCPGMAIREMKKTSPPAQGAPQSASIPSQLQNWPIQLHLVNPSMPAFREADLLIAADCTAFSLGAFHSELLKGKALVIACPKLDETSNYAEKIARIISKNNLASLTIARMEVPCCSGLTRLVSQARDTSGVHLPIREIVIGIQGGEILSKRVL